LRDSEPVEVDLRMAARPAGTSSIVWEPRVDQVFMYTTWRSLAFEAWRPGAFSEAETPAP
jgi:hypothetical protein